jgi:hypothetical protein
VTNIARRKKASPAAAARRWIAEERAPRRERLRREVAKLKVEKVHPKKRRCLLREGSDMKCGFVCEAPEHLAGGMAVRSDGRIAVGLCLAEPISQRQIQQR